MRVYASKNLGHGIRVGASTNLAPRRPAPPPRRLAPALPPVALHGPVYVARCSRPLKQWGIATAVVFVAGLAGLYPLLLIALPMLLMVLVAVIVLWRATVRAKRLTMESYQRRLSEAEYRYLVKAAKAADDMHVREVV